MSSTVDLAFIKQYESDVHVAYQQMGSKLRNTVRVKGPITGLSTTFQKVGKGTAAPKARHGKVPVMNIDHTPVECLISDQYAGDWVDKLDELKTNIDERQVTAQAGAYALGRKTDELIITAAATTSQTQTAASGLLRADILTMFETLWGNDIPDDGGTTVLVSPKAWSWLMVLKEFADADFVGFDNLPWAGTQAKRWNGAMWMTHTGLPKTGNNRTLLAYHKTAIGFAFGSDITSDITWHGDRAAHFINNMMSQGAALIDATGVVAITLDESVSLPAS